jgi:hypothetical protein
MNKMEQDLYKTALLGTNRMTPSVSTLEKLKELGIETDDATEAVLTGVGMLTLAQKAGHPLLDFKGKMPSICPSETKSCMTPKAAHYVKDVLDKKVPIFTYLQMAFFDLVAECAVLNNKIVPVELLPLLLERAWQPSIRQIIGERGLWLAAQNPEWQKLIEKTYTPPKMSVSEAAGIKLLADMSLKTMPNLYNKAFDVLKKTGLADEATARIALFWCTVVEEMER